MGLLISSLNLTLDGCVDHREGIAATPAGVLLGSGTLATELDRLDLIDEYIFLVHPRIAGHGPTLYRERAAQHEAARTGLGNAAPQRGGRHALPARVLTLGRLRIGTGSGRPLYNRAHRS